MTTNGASPGSVPPHVAADVTRRITLLSAVCAVVLIIIKAAAWWASGSVALLASLADSGLDLLASLSTVFAVRYAASPPDPQHRYGHGKAEAFAGLIQGALVLASAGLIGREAIVRLIRPQPVAAEEAALLVMVISTLVTLALIAAQTRALKAVSSVAVAGDRLHYAADVSANLAALAGIAAAALLGLWWADAAAALVVVAGLLWGGFGIFKGASEQLLDRELPEAARAQIRRLVTADPAILDVHQLRTRASGPFVHIQMHVDLSPTITLDAAHAILVAAERRVLDAFPAADILIHADPRGSAEPHGGAFGEEKARDPAPIRAEPRR